MPFTKDLHYEKLELAAGEIVSTLLAISALGIYIHALFLSISLGFPWVIMALLFKWWRTRDFVYYDAARTITDVLGVNFALGAITGTLVEFGLVQAWSGSIFVIATFGFMPLSLELIAFVGEVVLLIMFIVTLGRVRAPASIAMMAAYLAMAIVSGAVITTVNGWLNVPWGTENLAANLYPFLPQYGPGSADSQALLKLKAELFQNAMKGAGASEIIQNPTVAQSIGLTLRDPFIAFLLLLSAKVRAHLRRGLGEVPRYALALRPTAIIIAMIGECVNDGGRYPYLILASQGGIGPAEFMNT